MYIIILYFACEKCIKSIVRSEVKYFFWSDLVTANRKNLKKFAEFFDILLFENVIIDESKMLWSFANGYAGLSRWGMDAK